MRGVIPAVVIDAIERRTQRRVVDLFDMISGTSIGGLITCSLAAGLSGFDIIDLFRSHGRDIFPGKLSMSVRGLFSSKATRLCSLLSDMLGEILLSECKYILVPSYDIRSMNPFLFRSKEAATHRDFDFRLVDVAMAACAAPTYFEPAKIRSVSGLEYNCLDGGLFANNPSMIAYVDMIKSEYVRNEDIMMVSIGTGRSFGPVAGGGWGLSNRIRPILEIMYDGIGDTVSHELSHILPFGHYVRFQVMANGRLDDISRVDEHIEAAGRIVASNEFGRLCRVL